MKGYVKQLRTCMPEDKFFWVWAEDMQGLFD